MIHYYKNVISKITWPRAWNMFLLFFGYLVSRITRKPWQPALPAAISIEPTTSCNLRCPQCPSGLRQFTRATGMLDLPAFQDIILQLRKHLHTLTFYFQGEPFLNKDLLKMVNFASKLNLFTITSTNAHFIDEQVAENTVRSGLDKLIISIDGLSQETYSQYRIGGQLHKVISATELLLKKKKELKSTTPHLVWQTVAFSHNEKELKEIKNLGKKMGVNEVKIKTAQIYDFEHGNNLMPSDENLRRYSQAHDSSFRIKNKLKDHCWRMWQGCVITWDGKVVPCCFDKDASHQLGDLRQESFTSLWKSRGYQHFRKAVLTGRKNIDICRNCSEGTRIFT